MVIDLTYRTLVNPATLGCISIAGCKKLPVEQVVWEITQDSATITLWIHSKKNNPVLFGVTVFRLPTAQQRFDERCEWWINSRKKPDAKLASGTKFDRSALAPDFLRFILAPSIAYNTKRHDAFITNKHNVIHIFERDDLGIIVQLHSKDASPELHDVLLTLCRSVSINPLVWVTSEIATKPSSAKKSIREAPLASAIQNEIAMYLQNGLDLLNLAASTSPEDRLVSMNNHLTAETRGKKLAAASHQTTLALGAVYASNLIERSNWEWVELSHRELSDAAVTNIVSPHRECYMNPFWVIEQIRRSKKQPNLLLSANMLIAGSFPFDAHYGYVYIS
ncbi:MAG: hypothetical protein ACKO14_05075 [Armatimonadota bacterium]